MKCSLGGGTNRKTTFSLGLWLMIWLVHFVPILSAQNEGPEGAVLRGVAAMERGEWQAARDIFEKVIADWGGDPFFQKYPPFGTVYYNKGFCEMRLKMYSEAAASFQKCHNDYPTVVAAQAEEEGGINVYWKLAVFQWAAAEQYQENFKEAINLYLKFKELEPVSSRDQYNEGAYHINLGICYAETGEVDQAEREVGKAIEESDTLATAITAQWQGFLAICRAHLDQEESNETQAQEFIARFSPSLLGDQLVASMYGTRLLNIALDAVRGDRLGIALRIFSITPMTEDVLRAAELRYPSDEGMPDQLKRVITALRERVEAGDPPEVNGYFGLAKAYENRGDKRAGYVVFDMMARKYLESKHRPLILYGATKAATEVAEMVRAQEHGMTFLEEFPDHEYRPAVSSLLLSSLFFNGEYEDCLEIAGKIRAELPVGSSERDLPDFVYSGSLYYLGEYQDAQPELDAHVSTFPESAYRENSQYYQASNLVKLFDWRQASEKLDAWLAKYEPENSNLLPNAYLDRAQCYFALSTPDNDGNAKALDLIEKIVTNHSESVILDRAYNLRGDIQQNEGMLEEAGESYEQALAIADAAGHEVTSAMALMQLVAVGVALQNDEEAIERYDTFFERFPEDSFYGPNVAVSGLTAFKRHETSRLPDALERLQRIIVSLGEKQDSDGMERAINSYTSFLLKEEEDPKDVIAILDNFPNPQGYRTLQAWLLIARINLIEERMRNDDLMMTKARVYYEELERSFDKAELGDFILYRVGSNIGKTNPFRARPWYQAILDRPEATAETRSRAEMELARIDASSTDTAVQRQALDQLKRIRSNHQDPAIVGPSTLELARTYHKLEEWEDANREWKAYMANRSFTEARMEATFLMGESFERLGKLDEALQVYSQVVVLFAAYLDYSAEAGLRIGRIQWDKGNRVDAFRFVNQLHFRMAANEHGKVAELEEMKNDFRQKLRDSGDWKDEYEDVRGRFGELRPVN